MTRRSGRPTHGGSGPSPSGCRGCRRTSDLPTGLPEPYAREMAGDWAGAAAAWERLGRPYDAALAWLGSPDEAGLRQALETLDGLGARAAATRRGGG